MQLARQTTTFTGKLFGAHGQGLRMVGAEARDFYFYTKRILALSKLYFERLPAMSWTWLQISGDPVFKTLGRFMDIFIGNIFEFTKQEQ